MAPNASKVNVPYQRPAAAACFPKIAAGAVTTAKVFQLGSSGMTGSFECQSQSIGLMVRSSNQSLIGLASSRGLPKCSLSTLRMSWRAQERLNGYTLSALQKSPMQVSLQQQKGLKDWLTPSGQKYKDFGEEIRLLAINLDLTTHVVQRAQNQAATFGGVSQYVQEPILAAHEVLCNFRETLEECERLLDKQQYFTKRDGFVTEVSFYNEIDTEVQMLSDRIGYHNIKVNGIPNGEIMRQKKEINSVASYRFLSRS